MAFTVTFPSGETVDFDEFAPAFFEDLAKRLRLEWWDVYYAPGRDSTRLDAVLVALAEQANVTPPEPAKTMGEFNVRRTEWLKEKPVRAEDASYEDGFPPKPGETDPGSTSTSPGGTDGLPTLSNDNPSGDS